jgi:high-affinity iron transporter
MVIIGALASLLWVAPAGPDAALQQPQPIAHPTATAPVQDTTAAVRRVVAIVELAKHEYRLGIGPDGRIAAAAEVEEARLFLAEARRTAATLPATGPTPAVTQLDSLIALVASTKSPDTFDAAARRLTTGLAATFDVALEEAPDRTPSLARGADVYRANCVSCHGQRGAGDGPLAATLNPKPADLTDAATMGDQSLLELYRRITIGVVGTAMPSFEPTLSADDRWAVALYASTLHQPLAAPILARVRAQLDSAYALARQGDGSAGSRALGAYMTFEQVERALRIKHPGLVSELEATFAAFQTQAAGRHLDSLATTRATLMANLARAEEVLSERTSPGSLFTQSFVILVREGLEALLIVGALLAFVVKMGAAHRRRDIQWGLGAAVVASVVTAIALETVFKLEPSRQEALEGATMIVATVVLFYVSYWLLSKMEVAKWNHFVKSKVHDALTSGSRLALASAAFLAVYREGFETVLFYKALFLSAGSSGSSTAVVGGILAGALVMVGVYVAINRFGMRLPLKPFFGVTSAFLYYTAFVFAGKGVADLQEGGWIGSSPVSWAPRVPTLGIYPTVQSLTAQGILLVLLVVAVAWTFFLSSDPPPIEKPVRAPTEGGRHAQQVTP